jgi:hypothetical protein
MEKEFQDKVSRVKNRVQVDSQAIIEDNNRRLSLKIAEIRQQGVQNREIFREFILKKILE